MTREIFVLIAIYVVGVVFSLIPESPRFDAIVFSEHFSYQYKTFDLRSVSVVGYFYHFMEHIGKILVFHILHVEIKSYRKFWQSLFWFQVIDLIDFVLTYNSDWFYIGKLPITLNVVGCFVSCLVLLKCEK